MGAFYSSIQIRSEDRDAVRLAAAGLAGESKRKFLIGPLLNGWVGVYPEDVKGHDDAAQELARRLNTIALQLIIHDDSVFLSNFFRGGELVSEYSSNPDYFGEIADDACERLKPGPEIFREMVDSPEKLAKMARVLDPETEIESGFEQDRLEEFAKLLGIQNTLTSYEYLEAGERGGVKGWKQFIHIPDNTAEKKVARAVERKAKKDAETALSNARQKLVESGVLCHEWEQPYDEKNANLAEAEICADPLGFVVLWRNRWGAGYTPQLIPLQPPWEDKPQPVDYKYSSTVPESLRISSKGTWLAFWDGTLSLWDWRERRPIGGLKVEAFPMAFSQDEKLLLCQTDAKKFVTVSLETREVVRTFKPETMTGDFMALHPSNAFIVTKPDDHLLGIVRVDSGAMSRMSFPDARKMEFSPDGKLLFSLFGDLQAYVWEELLASEGKTPVPEFAASCGAFDMALDHAQNRVLFGTRENKIEFLNFGDNTRGVLLDPPDKMPIWKLKLSTDRKFLCSIVGHSPPRIQIWDYAALCKAALG